MIKYHLEQIIVRSYGLFKSNWLYKNTVLTNSSQSLTDYKEIHFYLDHDRLMHLGDQLFFKPLVMKLVNEGYTVSVKSSRSMIIFFEYNQKFPEDYSNTLIISSSRLLLHLQNIFGIKISYFLFDTNSINIDSPVANYICEKFSNYFSLSKKLSVVSNTDFLIETFDNNENLLPANYTYILFNNYYDSGLFRVFPSDKKRLINHLKLEHKKYKVVHLGSNKDFSKDNKKYNNIVDIDLRGKTTIKQLYALFLNNKIHCVYTFDTFTLHLANIFNCPVKLVLKRFLTEKERKQKQIAFSSLFQNKNKNIQILK